MANLRPLVIDNEARAKAAAIVSFAEWHPFHPELNKTPPGDVPDHVGMFGDGYRAVFSFTHMQGLVFRHLSVSVPGDLYPNPVAVFAIADLFGFSGWTGGTDPGPTWTFSAQETHTPARCIVVIEPVRMTVPEKERN